MSTAQLGSLQRDTSLSTLLGFVGLASSLAASFPHVWIWKLRSRQRQPLWASVALSAGRGWSSSRVGWRGWDSARPLPGAGGCVLVTRWRWRRGKRYGGDVRS